MSAEPLETREVGKGKGKGTVKVVGYLCALTTHLLSEREQLSCIVQFAEALDGGGAAGPRGVERGS